MLMKNYFKHYDSQKILGGFYTMKLFDLRLRGSGFTLGTIVNETDHYKFRSLISYLQSTITDKNAEVPVDFDFMPTEHFSLEECADISKWLLSQGYAKREGVKYTLIAKTFDVFEKTIAKDNELSKSGFHCCPCHMF